MYSLGAYADKFYNNLIFFNYLQFNKILTLHYFQHLMFALTNIYNKGLKVH